VLRWLLALAVAAGPPADPIAVDGHELNQVIDCRGRMVRVSGSLSWLTLQGKCPVVSVEGSGNRVRIEAVERLHLSGCDNTVTWERSLKGETPEIDVTCHNEVSRGAVPGVGASKEPRPARTEAEVKADVGAALRKAFGAIGRSGPGWMPPGGPEIPNDHLINFYAGGVQHTTDCAGKDVTVWGSDDELTYRGVCGTVTVKGSHDAVRLESAKAIDVPGVDNAVTYRSGKPKVTVSGKGSAVAKAK